MYLYILNNLMEVDEIWILCIELFSVINISFIYSSELSRKKS